MKGIFKGYIFFALLMLAATIVFGLLASWAFLYPESFNGIVPFQQLRPLHVSAALFWIISGAACCAIIFSNEVFGVYNKSSLGIRAFIWLWVTTIVTVFVYYFRKEYGGREYWEFPSWLSIPLLISWVIFMGAYYIPWLGIANKKPMYLVMWATGILFFFLTFLEQNLWHIDWFRQSYLREVTVQWKANGSMVGAWNQMIYGSSLYLMVKISGDKTIAENKQVKFFYFLSLTNLMFNWGHHIYNLPTANWVRHVSYVISMTEWLFFISMIRSFKSKMDEYKIHNYRIPYKFLSISELWLFLNLTLALMMSIPAINRYTHGTHITVAHAMGTTIGINSMILLGAIGYILGIDTIGQWERKVIQFAFTITQVSFFIFWVSLIAAGLLKGYRSVGLGMNNFQEMMQPVLQALTVFSFAGIFVVLGLLLIIIVYIKRLWAINTTLSQDQ